MREPKWVAEEMDGEEKVHERKLKWLIRKVKAMAVGIILGLILSKIVGV